MAYDSRYRIAVLAASMITAAVAAIQYSADAWSTFTDNLVSAFHSVDWPSFIPTASESIELDRMANAAVDEKQFGIWHRFLEFTKRALTHADFGAGHFEPDRMPA